MGPSNDLSEVYSMVKSSSSSGLLAHRELSSWKLDQLELAKTLPQILVRSWWGEQLPLIGRKPGVDGQTSTYWLCRAGPTAGSQAERYRFRISPWRSVPLYLCFLVRLAHKGESGLLFPLKHTKQLIIKK